MSTDKIVWIDCEMTGLDPEVDELVEVACIVTDYDLQPLDEGIEVVIKPGAAALEQMNDFVRSMHVASGLLPLLETGTTLEDATAQVLAYVKKHVPVERKALLGGNSVGTDKVFLTKYMAPVVDHLHYRIIDVSSVKELAKKWFPEAYHRAPAKTGGHRALGDIKDSIVELRYYRRAVFTATAPSAESAKQIAAEVSGAAGPKI